jgi:hypothetical protein
VQRACLIVQPDEHGLLIFSEIVITGPDENCRRTLSSERLFRFVRCVGAARALAPIFHNYTLIPHVHTLLYAFRKPMCKQEVQGRINGLLSFDMTRTA